MENNLLNYYVEKYLVEDIRLNNEDDDGDFLNLEINPFDFVKNEFSLCNQSSLREIFNSVKNQVNVIVEIGVARVTESQTYEQTSTSVFLKDKKESAIYLGIDIEDKSSLSKLGSNIFTLQARSESYDIVKNKLEHLKITQIDFLFIDGWHSINQVISELWYVDFMKSGGIIGFHDTNYHPGPSKVVEKLNPEIFEVKKYCEGYNDWGISFAKLK